MHDKLNEAAGKLKQLEGLLSPKQQMLDGIKAIIDDLKAKQTIRADDENALDALIIIIDYYVKDSSIT